MFNNILQSADVSVGSTLASAGDSSAAAATAATAKLYSNWKEGRVDTQFLPLSAITVSR
jgi:hypothetical protein